MTISLEGCDERSTYTMKYEPFILKMVTWISNLINNKIFI